MQLESLVFALCMNSFLTALVKWIGCGRVNHTGIAVRCDEYFLKFLLTVKESHTLYLCQHQL